MRRKAWHKARSDTHDARRKSQGIVMTGGVEPLATLDRSHAFKMRAIKRFGTRRYFFTLPEYYLTSVRAANLENHAETMLQQREGQRQKLRVMRRPANPDEPQQQIRTVCWKLIWKKSNPVEKNRYRSSWLALLYQYSTNTFGNGGGLVNQNYTYLALSKVAAQIFDQHGCDADERFALPSPA